MNTNKVKDQLRRMERMITFLDIGRSFDETEVIDLLNKVHSVLSMANEGIEYWFEHQEKAKNG